MATDKDYDLLCDKFRHVLESQNGKDVIWYILGLCDIYSDAFTGDNRTHYIEGKRSVGLEILQVLEDLDPTTYARLLINQVDMNNE